MSVLQFTKALGAQKNPVKGYLILLFPKFGVDSYLFGVFKKVFLIILGSSKIDLHQYLHTKSQEVPPRAFKMPHGWYFSENDNQ